MNTPNKYDRAVETIKTAILQGQYEAAKGVNRIQLAVYFGIGKQRQYRIQMIKKSFQHPLWK